MGCSIVDSKMENYLKIMSTNLLFQKFLGMTFWKKFMEDRRVTVIWFWNQPNISTDTTIKQNTKSCTYVGLYGSGLFTFGSYVSFPTLFACFLGFDIPTSSFTFIKSVFLLFLYILYTCINNSIVLK